MRNFVLGLVVALSLIGAYRAYQWRVYQNDTAWASRVTYTWLSEPVAKDQHGKPLSRAQVLDAIIKQAASNEPNQ